MKLWGGRFRKKTAPSLEKLGRSIDFDRRLGAEEIRINQAYARGLQRAGRLTADECRAIEKGLDEVGRRLKETPPPFLDSDEDIHTAVERLLAENLSDPELASKLPTGRSRNDLAATGFRLYLAGAIEGTLESVQRIQRVLVEKAKASASILLPGYTHMRRGQPVVFAQYLLAWFWVLERDRARLRAARERALELPLGAGALAGNPFGVDRDRLARELGFPFVLPNSIDAVSSRDFALEFLSAAAILGVNLSRMAEDLILWSGAEFSFVSFDESYATGSSLMPQKQNPDGLELTRGKTGRLVGDLVSLLTTAKGLATGYQRDLQEDKEPVFDALD
ncbi:MAG TPA: argininosuccinate lyase, partial [Vicinamibacteria bacterium]